MNFQDFQATRRRVDDLGEAINAEFYGETGEPIAVQGYVYDGDTYIEICDDGDLLLQIYAGEWKLSADRLTELELRLYAWCVVEFDIQDPTDLYATGVALNFADRLLKTMGHENFQEMRKRNLTANGDVCHSHDFCDANVVMFEAVCETAKYFNRDADISPTDEGTIMLMNTAWDIAAPLLGCALPEA